MREIRPSGSEGGARFNPLSLPLSSAARTSRRRTVSTPEKQPGLLDELVVEQTKLLEKESGELKQQATELAGQIEELSGETTARIA